MIGLLHALFWNLTLVAVAAFALWLLCLARFMRERPALRHSLWLLLLLKMITPPVVPVPVLPAASYDMLSVEHVGAVVSKPISSANRGSSPADVSDAPTEPSISSTESQVPSIVLYAWGVVSLSLCGTLMLWFAAIDQSRRLRRLAVDSLGKSHRSTAALTIVADRFGLRRLPSVLLVNGACSPMVWVDGRRVRIFMPQKFEEASGDEQLRHMLAHEVAHIVRYDHLSNLIGFLVASLFWWNPVAWFARREMLSAAETCCDALAIERLAESRKSYATTLVDASDFVSKSNSASPLLEVQFGESHSLRRRVEMIANVRVKSALSRGGRLTVIVAGLMALMLVPVQAQDSSKGSSSESSSANTATEPAADLADALKPAIAPQPRADANEEEVGNRAQDNQPKIKNARLVTWGGEDKSSRAYFFKTKQTADSFAKTIAAFRIAEQIRVVVSETDQMMFDDDRNIMTTRPNMAEQLGLNSDKFVLLWGTRDQHARVEAVIVALGAE